MDLFVEITGMVPPHREVLVERWLPSTTMPENRYVFLYGIETARSPWPLDTSVFNVIQQVADAVTWGVSPANTALEQLEEMILPRLRDVYGIE